MATWQVQDAKTRLSELIERARTEGPQTITRHGAERAVVLSIEDYRALEAHKPDIKAYLLSGPKLRSFRSSATVTPAVPSSCDRGGRFSTGHQRHLRDAEDPGRHGRHSLSLQSGCGSIISERS